MTQKENWYDNMIKDNRFEMFVIKFKIYLLNTIILSKKMSEY